MTPLEYILIGIIWLGYGFFAAYQSKTMYISEDNGEFWIFYPLLAPVVFICKALYGAFKQYK